MITGIFLPDSGSVQWHDGHRNPQERIGYLPEERGLYRQMKIIELLAFLAEIKGRRGPDVIKSIDRWLERFELTDKRNAKIEELSKGNQQKVQLIGTLLHDPDLIVLDLMLAPMHEAPDRLGHLILSAVDVTGRELAAQQARERPEPAACRRCRAARRSRPPPPHRGRRSRCVAVRPSAPTH